MEGLLGPIRRQIEEAEAIQKMVRQTLGQFTDTSALRNVNADIASKFAFQAPLSPFADQTMRLSVINERIAGIPPLPRDDIAESVRAILGTQERAQLDRSVREILGANFERDRNIFQSIAAALPARIDFGDILRDIKPVSIAHHLREFSDSIAGSHMADSGYAQAAYIGSIDVNAINRLIDSALDDVRDIPRGERAAAFLHAVVAQAKELSKRPVIALTLIILAFMLKAAVEGEVQFYSGEMMKPVRARMLRAIAPTIGRVVEQTAPAVDPRSLRLVAATNLRVRVAPRQRNSRVLGTVSIPTVVSVVRQHSDWTLIEYDEGSTTIRGWVFTRYLRPITARPSRQ